MSLTIDIKHNPHFRGPNGEPLLYGTHEEPAMIEGQVVFQTDQDFKGQDVNIDYTVQARASWRTRGGTSILYDCQLNYAHKIISMILRYRQPGLIRTGRYSVKLQFPIDPANFPNSMTLRNGWVQYKIVATLPRKFPNRDIVVEQLVYVVNSSLPSPFSGRLVSKPSRWTTPITLSTKTMDEFSYKKPKARPPPSHICEIPTAAFFAGEVFPVAISTLVDNVVPTAPAKSKKKGVFSKLKDGFESDEDEIKVWPSVFKLAPERISVRVEQIIIYKNFSSTGRLPESREFELQFSIPQEIRDQHPDGFMTVLRLTLPQLADVDDHLKPSMNCKALEIRHLFKVNLKFEKITHKFVIPITISAPAPAGVRIPYRFQFVDWVGTRVLPKGAQPTESPVARFNQMGSVFGSTNVLLQVLEATHITKVMLNAGVVMM
ncbi:hypothetical protein BGZ83_003368 [Gryganskiella cystojenkinii]|nr:hypothetical protein BGZ83_003368 [Gryganskiella cystojenkinii]